MNNMKKADQLLKDTNRCLYLAIGSLVFATMNLLLIIVLVVTK